MSRRCIRVSNNTVNYTMSNRIILLLLPILFAVAGCDSVPTAGIPNIVFPERNVSFSAHVQPLFDASCATSDCHDEFTQAGDLQLRTYFDLFRRPGVVIPNDSLRSVLSQVMSDRLHHTARQIIFIASLNQRRGVSTWIQEGALNN